MMNTSNWKWIFKVLLLVLAVVWGLTANGAEILNAPGFVARFCGDYFTEVMALIIAWVSYDVYVERY